ncbi:MAG: VWA domain-containing protein [Chlorobium limicola]|uniref:von Willebrand factor type A n=1 Tax=Chlorobium limicola (strain DSM 245 / NBRC 103803 / 6330) TaxID=290315 RepID=B3ED17_CHLL2|nr:VWA domain-containing protein [Chlorobium limicola]ACD90442.1 conserved hypothetical protein [Chlorobium limicola DSM 245]NTV09079.1 VWA domain-containing protein [Chlorobium limicola]NTV21609.1 VWA domain-containing protein [Chlorobium limicola]
MKKRLLPFLVAACALPASTVLEAGPIAWKTESAERTQPGDASGRSVMQKYALQYDNLRPVEGRCPSDYKLVQLALLLDTSNSMDGLINQAKSQLWRIVNETSRMHKRGEQIRLQVALYEYGNNSLSPASGYIRQVTPFTEDLDLLSEALFSLTTNGGSEYCGHVIGSSLNRLRWNSSRQGLKMIYIAGNEPFNQGEVNYEAACRWAAERDITVNTIYCGDYRTGVDTFWQRGAAIGRGGYFAIDSDRETMGIITPYDDDLMVLNNRINGTYVPYGRLGREHQARQEKQDMNAAALAAPVAAERAASKGSRLYQASDWDLVDAIEKKHTTIERIDRSSLPEELKGMSRKELDLHVQKKRQEREELKKQIADLGRQRDAYVRQKESEATGSQSLGTVILKNLHTQAKARNFTFR